MLTSITTIARTACRKVFQSSSSKLRIAGRTLGVAQHWYLAEIPCRIASMTGLGSFTSSSARLTVFVRRTTSLEGLYGCSAGVSCRAYCRRTSSLSLELDIYSDSPQDRHFSWRLPLALLPVRYNVPPQASHVRYLQICSSGECCRFVYPDLLLAIIA